MKPIKNPFDYQLCWYEKVGDNLVDEFVLYGFSQQDWIDIFHDDFEKTNIDIQSINEENYELISGFLPKNFKPDFNSYDYMLEVVQSDEVNAMQVYQELVQPLQEARQTIERLKEILNERKPVISEKKVAV